MATTPETNSPVTVFATSWCPFCARLIADLRRADLAEGTVDIIDVDAPGTEALSEWIESVNDGNRIVPTVLYSDGSHATNPPAADVLAKIAELS
ncbi:MULTISPECIES: glutaredoxin domain-containing protein [unclassified Corynebacterium]|uniref:glutaredoxin domain-containing protein n=1 Tax=unclassified Corynebacterium TaxID=2624378 RepID=UPI0021AA26D3|nr:MULTISPECIES: glutaredoxin domain-containing protein [unclassified Corynebacterium]MCT1453377.1 NrdH-redoxin [Corynebacterium sp. p3-SID1145]MCT1462414.1 NrdH-redoxin [Corynebacterium sp. p3-SID1140]MDN8595276.1 glutaredoxin domain-containing protein [Corynebacterium sp. P4_F2]WKK56529.1 glutaredoxin domain-containing protein [Corynebacterium sp. P4-C1]WKK63964.1 glutaredoxin domain-containing protein [Corynebacterium sp. P8-C1]